MLIPRFKLNYLPEEEHQMKKLVLVQGSLCLGPTGWVNYIRACCYSTAYIQWWRSGSIRICQTECQNWNHYPSSTQHRPRNTGMLVQS